MPDVKERTQREVEYITLEQFQQMLAWAKGAKIVTITALTVPSYKKTGFKYKDNIQKYARINAVINWNYQNAVNRQRVREGKTPDFEALPRQWGTRLTGLPFVSHVNRAGEHKLYLELKRERVYDVSYSTLDGEEIPTEEVEPFLTEKDNPRQELDKEIVLRDFDVKNILSIVIDGKDYIIQ